MGSLDRPREGDVKKVADRGDALLEGLAARVRGDGLTAVIADERLRVTARPGGRGVVIEARRRADDTGRWWFAWGGQIWLSRCEDTEAALVDVRRALRQIGGAVHAPRCGR